MPAVIDLIMERSGYLSICPAWAGFLILRPFWPFIITHGKVSKIDASFVSEGAGYCIVPLIFS